jgi:hypothetical protein
MVRLLLIFLYKKKKRRKKLQYKLYPDLRLAITNKEISQSIYKNVGMLPPYEASLWAALFPLIRLTNLKFPGQLFHL